MPLAAPAPLSDLLRRTAEDHALRPIPLVGTRIDVNIRGGLAVVTTERTFRNREQKSVEAMLTFPVPVDATLCALSARVGGRTLTAVAQARDDARLTYEDAISKGKAAVLHEELLRGIHMLSVAHLAPGAEVVVCDTWTTPLTFVDARPRLRIPTTVGEIYGQSPLAPSDDLVAGDAVQWATIAIACESGTASLLRAGKPGQGGFDVSLDAPIDIVVDGWTRQTLTGIAADGRQVTLQIEPAPKSQSSLDVDLLFDRSSSMAEPAAGDAEHVRSKFDVAKSGLWSISNRLRPSDRIRLWEFNDQASFVGDATGPNTMALVQRLREPAGGTEIGSALNAVIGSTTRRNVVIVTDGKSWALDAQALARSGLRVTAVLIGEDALEAAIANLAGITGGQVFIATGSDADASIAAALEVARMAYHPPSPIESAPVSIETFRRGARVVAAWGSKTRSKPSAAARQIGATAAALAMPLMPESAAAKLAEAEGIVSHLTSLVLVDEAGHKHEGLPGVRKVPLSTPQTFVSHRAHLCIDAAILSQPAPLSPSSSRTLLRRLSGVTLSSAARAESAAPARMMRPDLHLLVGRIDWDADPEALRQGDLSGQPLDVLLAISEAAELPSIIGVADALGLAPAVLVISLMARASANRSAQRLARAVLGESSDAAVVAAMRMLGLEAHAPSHRII